MTSPDSELKRRRREMRNVELDLMMSDDGSSTTYSPRRPPQTPGHFGDSPYFSETVISQDVYEEVRTCMNPWLARRAAAAAMVAANETAFTAAGRGRQETVTSSPRSGGSDDNSQRRAPVIYPHARLPPFHQPQQQQVQPLEESRPPTPVEPPAPEPPAAAMECPETEVFLCKINSYKTHRYTVYKQRVHAPHHIGSLYADLAHLAQRVRHTEKAGRRAGYNSKPLRVMVETLVKRYIEKTSLPDLYRTALSLDADLYNRGYVHTSSLLLSMVRDLNETACKDLEPFLRIVDGFLEPVLHHRSTA